MSGLRRAVTTAGVAVLKRNVWLRGRYRLTRARLRYGRYRWHAARVTDPATIVFESFTGRSYAGSPRAVYEAMLDDPRFVRCRFVWIFRDPDAAGDLTHDARTSLVRFGGAEYYRAYGRARTWVGNSILATELVPRPGGTYLQCWHGTPLKRIGLDVVETTQTAMNGKAEIDDRYRVEGRKVTAFLSSSPLATACFASAFGLPVVGAGSPFVETGNPRNDVLVTATPDDVAAARERLGIPPDKRVVLYAPTWRDDQHESRAGYVYRQPLDLEALRDALGEDHLILFRTHYLVNNVIDFAAYEGFVRDVSAVDDINELCLVSDLLVTDYSSVYFDYALLDRPMVFFMYDLERYQNALRGFYLPIEDVPGPIVTTQDELVRALRDPALADRDAARRARLNETMSPHDDGHATERVLDLLHARLTAPTA